MDLMRTTGAWMCNTGVIARASAATAGAIMRVKLCAECWGFPTVSPTIIWGPTTLKPISGTHSLVTVELVLLSINY